VDAPALLTNDELNAKQAASVGERVTRDYIDTRVVSKEFYRWPGSNLIVSRIVLDSGFSTFWESACVDPANFDQAIGGRLAYDQALSKLWLLFGFLLAEKRFTSTT